MNRNDEEDLAGLPSHRLITINFTRKSFFLLLVVVVGAAAAAALRPNWIGRRSRRFSFFLELKDDDADDAKYGFRRSRLQGVSSWLNNQRKKETIERVIELSYHFQRQKEARCWYQLLIVAAARNFLIPANVGRSRKVPILVEQHSGQLSSWLLLVCFVKLLICSLSLWIN